MLIETLVETNLLAGLADVHNLSRTVFINTVYVRVRLHRIIETQVMVTLNCPASLALLHHMGQFMRQQLLPSSTAWLIFTASEEDIVPSGEGSRLQGAVEGIG